MKIGSGMTPDGVRRRGLAVVLLMVASIGSSAAAQELLPQVDPEATKAISKIRSPFCPGLMLEVCPTTQAEALRDSIQAMAESGIGADSLVELVVAQYGEEYRAYPKTSGAGLWAWIVPPTVLILGLGLVVVALRHMREPPGTEPAEDISDEEQRRLDEAMAVMEAEEEVF